MVKISIDIDSVLVDLVKIIPKYNPNWDGKSWDCGIDFSKLSDDEWLKLPVLDTLPEHIKPYCYLSNRVCDVALSEQWLLNNNFPTAKVYHVKNKVEFAINHGIDVHIDDNYNNFINLMDIGVDSYLYHQPWNADEKNYGKKVYSLMEFGNYLL